VKHEKGDFVGRAALHTRRSAGLRRRLVAFGLEDKGIARHGYRARLDSEIGAAGEVTSGTWSPTFERAIGLARLEAAAAFEAPAPGGRIVVEVRGRDVAGRVEKLPFYRRAKS
jgi:aminomethyltransferase